MSSFLRCQCHSGPVNDGLFEVSPGLNQSLRQFSQVAYWLLVYTPLHATLDSLINGGLQWRPQLRLNEIRHFLRRN